MNEILKLIGGFLVSDKPQLSKWIQGLQHGFATFFFNSRQLTQHTKELEILKEFLAIKIEQLQIRVQELLNEKEDLEAMTSSGSDIKEHLLKQLNQLNTQFT